MLNIKSPIVLVLHVEALSESAVVLLFPRKYIERYQPYRVISVIVATLKYNSNHDTTYSYDKNQSQIMKTSFLITNVLIYHTGNAYAATDIIAMAPAKCSCAECCPAK